MRCFRYVAPLQPCPPIELLRQSLDPLDSDFHVLAQRNLEGVMIRQMRASTFKADADLPAFNEAMTLTLQSPDPFCGPPPAIVARLPARYVRRQHRGHP